ncbi:MAG: hypothetical protein J6P07_03810 [Spirochaetaceae bacterium]|nr:hypothetical protein [Spirochaetaceae bacterium]
MEYTYTQTDDQIVDFAMTQAKRRIENMQNRPLKILAWIILNLLFVTTRFIHSAVMPENLISYMLLYGSMIVLYNFWRIPSLFFIPKLVSRNCRSKINSNPEIWQPVETTIKIENGKLILEEASGRLSVVPLKLINLVFETTLSIAVYLAPNQIELVPKSVFKSKEEKRSFLSALQGN